MKIILLAKAIPATFSLMVAILAITVWQGIMGVDIMEPSNAELVRFGANFLPMTLGGEPWRLLSAGFLHIGITHLLFNGYALFYFGAICEEILGAKRFLVVFLLSVVSGCLMSLAAAWWRFLQGDISHFPIAAGASGGIMGLSALLMVLSFSPKFDSLDKNMLFTVMAINLIVGFSMDGIDNAGHIGGVLCGFIMAVSMSVWTRGFWMSILAIALLCIGAYSILLGQVAPFLR